MRNYANELLSSLMLLINHLKIILTTGIFFWKILLFVSRDMPLYLFIILIATVYSRRLRDEFSRKSMLGEDIEFTYN